VRVAALAERLVCALADLLSTSDASDESPVRLDIDGEHGSTTSM
jgi:hypothetical protein